MKTGFKRRIGRAKTGKWLLRVARIVVPITILTLIFLKIDFDQFKQTLQKADAWLVLLGLTHAPILILIGAIRWRILLRGFVAQRLIPFGFALKNYWISLSLGFFSPASLGMDAFRAFTCGRKFGSYPATVAAIIVEKLIALINCTSLIVILYPFIPAANPYLNRILTTAIILMVATIILGLLVIFLFSHKRSAIQLTRVGIFIERCFQKLTDRIGRRLNVRPFTFSLQSIFSSINIPLATSAFLLSFAIQLVSSIKSQIFFVALGYDLPFIVNLFAAPALYFIFLLPISLGSIGIREAIYILLYGLFGVPKEIALLVSLLNFGGMLLNAAIGGIIIPFCKFDAVDQRNLKSHTSI